MSLHILKMEQEKNNLNRKIRKLEKELNKKKTDENEKYLIKKQINWMKAYVEVLDDRIEYEKKGNK